MKDEDGQKVSRWQRKYLREFKYPVEGLTEFKRVDKVAVRHHSCLNDRQSAESSERFSKADQALKSENV